MSISTHALPRLAASLLAPVLFTLGLGGCSMAHLSPASSASRAPSGAAPDRGSTAAGETGSDGSAAAPTAVEQAAAPGAFPPGASPPGASPPGAFPPGAFPPGAFPPGASPLGDSPPATIWPVLRAGFRLPGKDRPAVREELARYAAHPGTVEIMLQRAEPYLYLITQKIRNRGMPTELALLPAVESGYDPFAYSQGRAAGLWQFIPGTARRFGLRQGWWFDGRRDVPDSTRAALDYLQGLADDFHGNWLLALASYNAGRGRIDAQLQANRRRHRPRTFWNISLPDETTRYVPKLLALSVIISHPTRYGVKLPPVPDKPYLETVRLKSQIDLAKAAHMAGISLASLYRYNPGYNRWATAPHGPHRLLVPVADAPALRQNLARLDPSQRVQWVRQRIRRGETLNELAKRSHTTVALLQKINHIHGRIIRAGHYILLPEPSRKLSHYTLSEYQRLRRLKEQPHGARKLTHVVRRGDSLWSIARHFGIRVSRLARWNGMAPGDTLHTGTRLVIWTGDEYASTEPARRLRTVHYTVHRGDSLSLISQRFNVSVAQLRGWNDISRGQYLQPGQRLVLHVDVLAQSGG